MRCPTILKVVAKREPIQLDAVIFGGGIAGLWTLDALVRSGRNAVLIERTALGAGQTIWSQGIIHGGLKYTLDGFLSGSAQAIRDMPTIWRECLAGQRKPDLSGAPVRSEQCWLWRTESLRSRVGMMGARVGLSTPVHTVDIRDRPDALKECPGTVARVEEQVIDPAGVLAVLCELYKQRLIHAPNDNPAHIEAVSGGAPTVSLQGDSVLFVPQVLIFAAGNGNAALRKSVGLDAMRMQVRELHMVLARGPLPELHGHCIDGKRTRVTITTAKHDGHTIWQIGGEIAERGVDMSPTDLIAHARDEVHAALPGVDLSGIEWATYRAPRAEGAMPSGKRPEDVTVLSEGAYITIWPTKLALAPRAAKMVVKAMPEAIAGPGIVPTDLSRPSIARPPWENATWGTA